MTRPAVGMSFIEVMIACLILALAIIPIADFLGFVTRGTKEDKCETEAMQFACDLMDFILMKMPYDPGALNGSSSTLIRGSTDIRYFIEATPIPWNPVKSFDIKYHDPCGGGAEQHDLNADIFPIDERLETLDKEMVDQAGIPNPSANDFDLCDFKLVVEWKPTGVADENEFKRRPIVLYSRKARL